MQPSAQPSPAPYPATFEVDHPEGITNWRPLVQWLLAFPHFLVLYGFSGLSQMVALVSWFAILFTGKLPAGLADVQCLFLRYANRTYAYAGFLREEYPPFGFATTPADPGDDPGVRTSFAPQLDDRNRLTVAFRIILVIPQIVVLFFLAIAAYVALVIGLFAVLFTGRWPEGLRDFVVGVLRWGTRVNAYHLLLVDEYPPFSLH